MTPEPADPQRVPTSTYRLQVRPGFDLHAVADVCDYLATLGVGAIYLSPLLPSSKGSDHGYDVIGFDRVDPQRGGVDGWTRVLAAANARGLSIVIDIVPNHAGVARPPENAAWWDVLRNGPQSPFADWFDIDWSRGRLLLPVLGDDATDEQLEIVGDELRYFDHRFPLAPGSGPRPGETAADVHARQHYELVGFRRGDSELNYRRFFSVSSLAGLRVEDPEVFAATHQQIDRWVTADRVAGLRIDHPDGLADPGGYLTDLRQLVGPETWITVEKILEPGEELPAQWPVAGTTGYDALTEVTNLFVDPAGQARFDEVYRTSTGDGQTFAEHVTVGKRAAATTLLRAEVNRLSALVPEITGAADAITALLVAFPVYRSYLPGGAEHLRQAVDAVRAAQPGLASTVERLLPRLSDPADELCVRFQQTSGAVMAKGVEDTAYYRYARFVALNEVGGDPSQFGADPAVFHSAQHRRQRNAPRGMTTLSTHDTKRSEDVRARLFALSELPERWAEVVSGLMAAAPLLSDAPFAYLLWQTVVGTGFIARERLHAYAEKAMREAAVSTTWVDPDKEFEAAVHALVDRAYDDPAVHGPLQALSAELDAPGWSNALAQKLVHLTMPGVPDIYQGTELWDRSLVDPDNRRDVDFAARRHDLDTLDADVHAPAIDGGGAAKQWVVSRTLRLRRDWPELFSRYVPLTATGSAAGHAVAFDRGGVITVATRLPVGLGRAGGWGDTLLDLGGRATDAISGVSHHGEVALADLLRDYPVALLVR